jgi:hypothetical protein
MARDVIGADAQRYRLTHRLGAGGQGAVYAVEGGRLAAKILLDRSEARRFTLRAALEDVRGLPVEDLAIARPLVVLRAPECGYIMELLTGMVPIARLARPEGDDTAPWYLAGGGLRRRLAVLASAATTIHQLHSRTIAWGDPSPLNVFIAEDTSSDTTRLIDTDNLRWSSRPGPSVYTEGYAAPELKTGRSGINTLTDAHAMAVIAFEVLTLCHPLLGDAVRDADEDTEQAALRGEWPWIDDADDDRNRCSSGLPREEILTRGLRDVFARFFGKGLTDSRDRPGIGDLASALSTAAAATLRCPGCAATYLFRDPICPWCDHPRPAFLLADVARWNPERAALEEGGDGRPYRVGVVAVTSDEERTLPTSLAGRDGIRLRLDGTRLWVRGPGLLRSPDGRHVVDIGEEERPLDLSLRQRPWTLHLGPLDQSHRVIVPNLHAGGAG